MGVRQMRALLQDKMPTAIGAVDLAILTQGQIDTWMAQSPVAAVAGDCVALDFDHFKRLHDVVMSFMFDTRP